MGRWGEYLGWTVDGGRTLRMVDLPESPAPSNRTCLGERGSASAAASGPHRHPVIGIGGGRSGGCGVCVPWQYLRTPSLPGTHRRSKLGACVCGIADNLWLTSRIWRSASRGASRWATAEAEAELSVTGGRPDVRVEMQFPIAVTGLLACYLTGLAGLAWLAGLAGLLGLLACCSLLSFSFCCWD